MQDMESIMGVMRQIIPLPELLMKNYPLGECTYHLNSSAIDSEHEGSLSCKK